ncbi:MAG: transposase [Synergistaceae bacterium]|jgi:REP element-mobilizing transposase RayT|nr:transposase [Synergistaceae bacterium]
MGDMAVRKRNRLKNYDYNQNGVYFLTLCTKDRAELLCEISVGDAALGVPISTAALGVPLPTISLATPIIQFTPYGNIVKRHIENIPKVYSNVFLDKYVIMPNHIHLLLRVAAESNNGTVGVGRGTPVVEEHGTPRAASPTGAIIPKIINALKGLTSKKAGVSLWQRSYHDHIVRDGYDYDRIVEYIKNNPIRWREDCFYTRPIP